MGECIPSEVGFFDLRRSTLRDRRIAVGTCGPGTIETDNRPSSLVSEASKVAVVTFGFWAIKVLATRLGETGGDWVTMSIQRVRSGFA